MTRSLLNNLKPFWYLYVFFFSDGYRQPYFDIFIITCIIQIKIGVANGTSKNVGLGKFWQDLEISEAFLTSLEVSFLHGLYLLFLSLETFYQRFSGSDF